MPSWIRRGRSINVNTGLVSGSRHKSYFTSCAGRRLWLRSRCSIRVGSGRAKRINKLVMICIYNFLIKNKNKNKFVALQGGPTDFARWNNRCR